MIEYGIKKEEYREIKQFWIKRLCYHFQDCKIRNQKPLCEQWNCMKCLEENPDGYLCYPFDFIRFHRGYTSQTITFKLNNISLGRGNTNFGAPDKSVFILKLKERIK